MRQETPQTLLNVKHPQDALPQGTSITKSERPEDKAWSWRVLIPPRRELRGSCKPPLALSTVPAAAVTLLAAVYPLPDRRLKRLAEVVDRVPDLLPDGQSIGLPCFGKHGRATSPWSSPKSPTAAAVVEPPRNRGELAGPRPRARRRALERTPSPRATK